MNQQFCKWLDIINLFRDLVQSANMQAAQIEWKKLSPSELSCVDQTLRERGSNLQTTIRQGITPADARVADVRLSCRGQLVQQPSPSDSAPIPTPNILSSKPTFDCAKARSPSALIICSGSDGAQADWHLSASAWAYAFSLDEDKRKSFSQEQDDWFQSLNNTCKLKREISTPQRQCVIEAYHRRANSFQSKLEGDALAETKLTPEERAGIQNELLALGFLNEPADGEFGPKTREAIKKFQQARQFAQSNFLTAQQRQLLLPSPIRPASAPKPSTEPNPNTQLAGASPVNGKALGFADLERLVETPKSCSAARQAGRAQMNVRDPFNGRSSPGPACALATECNNILPAQISTLVGYLRDHPLLLSELRTQPVPAVGSQRNFDTLVRGLNGEAKRYAQHFDLSRYDCHFIHMTVSTNLFSLDNTAFQAKSGFEPFAALVHNYLIKLRAAYTADIAKYVDWSPYAHHYGQADEFAGLRAKYEAAFNASDMEGFLRLRPEFLQQQSAANEFKATLLRQTDELVALEDQLSDLSSRAVQEPISKIIESGTSEAISKLKPEISRLREIAPANRGDVRQEINQFTSAKRDIESKLAAAQIKLDDLNKRESRRQTVLSAATKALAGISNQLIKKRLGQDAVMIVGRLETSKAQLSTLAETPLIERPDYSDILQSSENALEQIVEIQQSARETNELVERVRALDARIESRGQRFLDSSTASLIKSLSNEADLLNQQPLPLSEVNKQRVTNSIRTLVSLEPKLPTIMDAQEMKYLASEFRMSRAQWRYQFRVDKLTDAESVYAATLAEGDEARYQIEISCNSNAAAFSILSFEKKGNEGKAIPWTAFGGGGVKEIRLRIDTDPAYGANLVLNGYSNAGAVRWLGDGGFKLINSSRFIFGDVFPGDQVEVATNFPTAFKRFCALLAGK